MDADETRENPDTAARVFIAEAVAALAAATGQTPDEVYDQHFAGREFVITVTGDDVTFTFADNDDDG